MNDGATLDLDQAQFNDAQVREVTGLRQDLLQAWVIRGHIQLAEPNPGRGRSRRYTAVDVVRLALIRRFHQFGVPVSSQYVSELLEVVEGWLRTKGELPWDIWLPFRVDDLDSVPKMISTPRSYKFSFREGDPYDTRLSAVVEGGLTDMRRDRIEPPDGITIDEYRRWAEEHPEDLRRPINEQKRRALAAVGAHAEPVLVIPVGEIVMATLLRLKQLKGKT